MKKNKWHLDVCFEFMRPLSDINVNVCYTGYHGGCAKCPNVLMKDCI